MPPAHRRRPRTGAVVAVLGAVLGAFLGAGVATAGPAAATATTAPSARSTPPGAAPTGAPTDAAQLEREVAAQEAALADASARLAALAADASAALEAHQDAARARDEALATHREQLARWDAAQGRLRDSQGQMARWTSQAYRHGVAASGVVGFVAVTEARSPGDLQQRVAVLRQVGRAEARSLTGAAEAEAGVASTARAAEETAREALRAAAAAQEAQAAVDAAVALQRQEVLALEGRLAGSRDAALAAQARAALVVLPPAGAGGDAAPLPGCASSDLTGFRNGRVPARALCPLPGAPGHALRSDAAAAFAQLSAAYAAAQGEPLCVTDSYRDLPSQVALRAAKPGLAAVPGTSNHGWGVALDLCGGVQDFGTEQHAWMSVNAPLFGWFHPAWARQGGSKPEAWHWEFSA